MIMMSEPADPVIHEAAIRIARRCRHIVQGVLREEEWGDADREFYLVLRDELERFVAARARPATGSPTGRPST